MVKQNHTVYKGDIVSGSLLVRESRVIARLLLDQADASSWNQAIVLENVLQKRSPVTAKRQARLIKSRLTLMEPELWKLVVHGNADVTVQALLAAAIKQSRLLKDFMTRVVHAHWQVFQKHLSPKDWQDFLEMCSQIDPSVDKWADTTRAKLKQVVFRILAEADYVKDTRSLELLPVSVVPEVKQYLTRHKELSILQCMEMTP